MDQKKSKTENRRIMSGFWMCFVALSILTMQCESERRFGSVVYRGEMSWRDYLRILLFVSSLITPVLLIFGLIRAFRDPLIKTLFQVWCIIYALLFCYMFYQFVRMLRWN